MSADATDKNYYLAGPMTGIPQFNFPAFDAAAKALRDLGYGIASPAELDDADTRAAALASPDGAPGSGTANGESWGDFLARDVKVIADGAAGVICLPGWEGSRGARLEVFVARLCDLPIYKYAEGAEDPVVPLTEGQVAAGLGTPAATGEVRVTNDATGGAKGRKPQRMELLPYDALLRVAELYAAGAEKYDAHNWRKGYDWSLSFGALQRHAAQFWAGEDIDPETSCPHMTAVVFHALALLTFSQEHPELDDRPAPAAT